MKWRKQEVGENTVPFFRSKKRDSKKGNCSEKLGFFQMTGRYVKGENKGQKKDNQVKENVQKKRDAFKKDNKKEKQWKYRCSKKRTKMRMSNNRQELTQKKKKIFWLKA